MVLLNLETAVSDPTGSGPVKSIHLRLAPADLAVLEPYRSNMVVCLANNHVHDCGPDGYAATLRHLADRGLRVVTHEAPRVVQAGARRFAVYALYQRFRNSLHRTMFHQSRADGVLLPDAHEHIVFVHWGDEHVLFPAPWQVILARKWHSWGISTVVGHHSHTAQGIDLDGANATAYSLGNLNMVQPDIAHSPYNSLGYGLSITYGESGIDHVERLSYLIDSSARPRPIPPEATSDYWQTLDEMAVRQGHGKLVPYLRYWRHSARRHIRNNLVGGFLPRIRKGGLKQAAIMCAWLVWPNRTLCRYPFLLLPDDRVWRQFGHFWDRWRAYPGRFADASEAGTTAADLGLMPVLTGSDSTK